MSVTEINGQSPEFATMTISPDVLTLAETFARIKDGDITAHNILSREGLSAKVLSWILSNVDPEQVTAAVERAKVTEVALVAAYTANERVVPGLTVKDRKHYVRAGKGARAMRLTPDDVIEGAGALAQKVDVTKAPVTVRRPLSQRIVAGVALCGLGLTGYGMFAKVGEPEHSATRIAAVAASPLAMPEISPTTVAVTSTVEVTATTLAPEPVTTTVLVAPAPKIAEHTTVPTTEARPVFVQRTYGTPGSYHPNGSESMNDIALVVAAKTNDSYDAATLVAKNNRPERPLTVDARPTEQIDYYDCFADSVVVKAGQSVGQIAAENATTVSRLNELNGGVAKTITGWCIKVKG